MSEEGRRLVQGHGGGASVQNAKLGETVELNIGSGVHEIEAAVHGQGGNNREAIVKDGKITDHGKSKYGDRLSFDNGILKIKDLKETDATTYFYKVGDAPHAITINHTK